MFSDIFYLMLDGRIGHPLFLPGLILLGLGVGTIAGMFGTGGGFLLTPALIYLFRVPIPVAISTSLCQTCGTSLASFLKYRRLKRGEPRIDLVMMGGSILGVQVGTQIQTSLSNLGKMPTLHGSIPTGEFIVDVLFLLILSITALFIIQDVRRTFGTKTLRGDRTIPGPLVTKVRIPPYIDLPNVHLKSVSVPMMAYLGLLLGISSGLLGIGGGVLFTPIMLYGFGLSARNAAGTGVLLLLVTVSVGTFLQALNNTVSLNLALILLIGSSIGSQIGALITHHIPNRYLRLILVLLIFFVIGLIGWKLLFHE